MPPAGRGAGQPRALQTQARIGGCPGCGRLFSRLSSTRSSSSWLPVSRPTRPLAGAAGWHGTPDHGRQFLGSPPPTGRSVFILRPASSRRPSPAAVNARVGQCIAGQLMDVRLVRCCHAHERTSLEIQGLPMVPVLGLFGYLNCSFLTFIILIE